MATKKILQHETYVIIGSAMVLLTFMKLMGWIGISSDWFWFIAGIALVLDGAINLSKDNKFKKKYRLISKEDFDRLRNKSK